MMAGLGFDVEILGELHKTSLEWRLEYHSREQDVNGWAGLFGGGIAVAEPLQI